mgnify:CR=1 FL=1
MNIDALNVFKFLSKPKRSKASAMLDRKNEAAKQAETNFEGEDISSYTMVDPIRDGRRIDLMTSVHMSSRHLDQGKISHRNAKARWQPQKNEQLYSPREVKLDAQLEFNFKRSGLIEVFETEADLEAFAAEQGY